jgi:hypothetical protein
VIFSHKKSSPFQIFIAALTVFPVTLRMRCLLERVPRRSFAGPRASIEAIDRLANRGRHQNLETHSGLS